MNNLRITGIDVRDFKRVKAFRLDVDQEGNLITIGGENAAGKSSLIDAIEATLCGVPRSLTRPVREGADTAKIAVRIPPYRVLRMLNDDGPPTLKIIHEEDGTIPRPQDFLKQLIGGIMVDPVEFLTAQPREQRATLQKLVGLDLSDLDAQIEEARELTKRLDVYQTGLLAKVEELPWHNDAPAEERSAGELAQQMEEIMQHNAGVDAAFQAAENAKAARLTAKSAEASARAEVERLKKMLQEARARQTNASIKADEAQTTAASLIAVHSTLSKRDDSEVRAALADVDAQNRKVRDNNARIRAREQWVKAEADLKEALERESALKADKKRKLSEVEFPIDGLGFDAEKVTYNDLPFAQASHAEQIRVAVAIALAQRGRLGLVLIRDASTIDKKMLRAIAEECAQRNAQVFAEVVSNIEDDGFDRECAFYVVDGERAGRDGIKLAKEEIA